MKIKCTYADCFRHFSSREAMITHKIKDPDHSYCEKCDVDCEDDMLLFIHQLGSAAHICCPVCALEFKTAAGRDRHLEQNHRTAQKLDCAGCQERFTSASALMHHIENDECSVIRQTDFQMQRAEKQIHKDAFLASGEPFSTTASGYYDPSALNANNGTDLLGARDVYDSSRSFNNALGGPIVPDSYEQFPPLSKPSAPSPATEQPTPTKSALGKNAQDTATNLMDFDKVEKGMAGLEIGHNAWTKWAQGGKAADSQGYIKGWLATMNSSSTPPMDNTSEVASMYDKKAVSTVSANVPPRVAPNVAPSVTPSMQPPNPNASVVHERIIHMPAHSIVSTNAPLDIERFFDSLHQKYICPGQKCGRQFATPHNFRQHLLTSAHVGGQVTCPTCLKRFATTFAWVAHCESASKRCDIRNSTNFNHVLREITGGVLGAQGHMEDGTVQYVAPKIEDW
ncbi:hypothetical protein ABEF95_015042 [Exophiala dermatitidis]